MSDRRFSLHFFLATGMLSGLSPKIPGTAGSAVLLLLWIVFVNTANVTPNCLISIGALLLLVALVSTHLLMKEYPDSKDPQIVVIDEWIGLWIALSLSDAQKLLYACTAFVFFRAFDIVKPWPVRNLESLPGAFGVVMDDVFAGIYAGVLLLVMQSYI